MDSVEIALIKPDTHHHMNSEILEALLGHKVIAENEYRNGRDKGTMKKEIQTLLKSYGHKPDSCKCPSLTNFKTTTDCQPFVVQNDRTCLNPDLCLTRSRYLPCQNKCSLVCKNNPFRDMHWTTHAFYIDGSEGTWTLHSHGEIAKNQPVMEFVGVYIPKGSAESRQTNTCNVFDLPHTGFELDATEASNLAKYARKSDHPNVLAHLYIHQDTYRVIFVACEHIDRDGEILWNFPKMITKLIKVKESNKGKVQDFILPLGPGGENISDMSFVKRVQDGLANIRPAIQGSYNGTCLPATPPPTINIIVPVPVPPCTANQERAKTKDQPPKATHKKPANTTLISDIISSKVAKIILKRCDNKRSNLTSPAVNIDYDNNQSIESPGLHDHHPAPPTTPNIKSPNQHTEKEASESLIVKPQQRNRDTPSCSIAGKGTTDRPPWNPSTKIDKPKPLIKDQASQKRPLRRPSFFSIPKTNSTAAIHNKCTKCKFIGKTRADLTQHYKDKHPATHPCILPPCEGQFWSAEQLRDHVTSAHKKGTYYACPHKPCLSCFPTQELLELHLRDSH